MNNPTTQKNKRTIIVGSDPCEYIEEIESDFLLGKQAHEVNINFDYSSKEWRRNKTQINNGSFTYKCRYVHSTGKICGKASCKFTRHKEPKIYNSNVHI
jgi:hypothetical protein